MGKKKILIINTGGTIGMQKNENGYAPAEGFLSKAISVIADMKNADALLWDLIEMSPLLDSSDMTVKEWNN